MGAMEEWSEELRRAVEERDRENASEARAFVFWVCVSGAAIFGFAFGLLCGKVGP